MIGGVVEVLNEGQSLTVERGFLKATTADQTSRLPLDDLSTLIVTARSATLSRALLDTLAARGIPVVLAGRNFNPSGFFFPVRLGEHVTGHPEDQALASESLKDRLWTRIVTAKIRNQAAVLAAVENVQFQRLLSLADRVEKGDPENLEARAARTYFPSLFGAGFARCHEEDKINAFLNYGYAILRACCARSLIAVGLVPALGIHHKSRRNPLCLADDLMEVFRPFVDLLVWELVREGFANGELGPQEKKRLARVMVMEIKLDDKRQPVVGAIHRSALSLALSLKNKKPQLEMPQLRTPLSFAEATLF